jgi:flagellar basal-body rod protein FlgB
VINALFVQPNYLAAKKLLDATALRQEAIASNLANIETPGYRRVDLNATFAGELRQALAVQDTAHLNSLRPTLAVDTTARPSKRDGNTVELETELLNLNQNDIAHRLETHLVTGALLRLRAAITGRTTSI